ncbi:MAG: hypothetical protein QHH09_00175 [Microgenomates group bacterium]|nr:hypothetical protein [Microgenomates group bacterium]
MKPIDSKTDLLTKILVIRLEYFLYSLGFFIPFFIGHPQWLTGTAVNCLLFLAAQRISFKKVIPLTILPSLAAVLNGILFGPATVFLYYFLPFIWLGNLILVWVFRKIKDKSYFLAVFLSSAAKFFLLFSSANLYFSMRVVPKIFLTAMGSFQILTSLAGGALSYLIVKKINDRS